jgi:hypothetical protein
VTRKAVLSNETIELSQARFQRGPEMQQLHVRGEMDFFRFMPARSMPKKQKPGEAGLLTNTCFC